VIIGGLSKNFNVVDKLPSFLVVNPHRARFHAQLDSPSTRESAVSNFSTACDFLSRFRQVRRFGSLLIDFIQRSSLNQVIV
jgi:hypothetical protein